MSKFATNSWQAREALIKRFPYTTSGAMRATQGPQPLPWGHRLPTEWQERYRADQDRMTYIVWSYDTPIAWVLDDNSVVKVDYKWSRTTTGHQGLLYALDASRETRAGIYEAAQRERQAQRDRRAERQSERGMSQYAINASRVDARSAAFERARETNRRMAESRARSSLNQEGFYADLRDAMRSEPQDYDALISEVQGMVVR